MDDAHLEYLLEYEKDQGREAPVPAPNEGKKMYRLEASFLPDGTEIVLVPEETVIELVNLAFPDEPDTLEAVLKAACESGKGAEVQFENDPSLWFRFWLAD